MLGSSSVLI
jgi:hypothetical protein